MLSIILITLALIFVVAVYWHLDSDNKVVVTKAFWFIVSFLTIGLISHSRSAVASTWEVGSGTGNYINSNMKESVKWLDENVNDAITNNGGVIKAAAKVAKQHRDDWGFTELGKVTNKYYKNSIVANSK